MRKSYGESRENKCPFCGKLATATNEQNIPVCREHTRQQLQPVRCACGSWTEMKESKWGPFFLCDSCGPISFRKGIEMLKFMPAQKEPETSKPKAPEPPRKPAARPTMIVRSDDPRFF